MAARKQKPPQADAKKNENPFPQTRKAWVQYINARHDEGLAARRRHEFSWVINIAYEKGYQHILWNPRSGLLEIPRDRRVPLVINRIGSFVEARHAKLTKQRPVPRVIPNTNDVDDKLAAKASDHALRHLWNKIDMDAEEDKRTYYMLTTGCAFMRSLWDPMSGDAVFEPKKTKDGKSLQFSDEGTFQEEKIMMGEVSTVARSPFSIIPGNDAIPTVKGQPYIIERDHLPVSLVESLFPDLKGKITHRDSGPDDRTQYEKLLQNLTNPHFATAGVSEGGHYPDDPINSEVLVKTFWMKPNTYFEEGVVAVVVGREHLAMIDTFPNDFGRNIYPFVKFQEKEDGFHFWPQSTVERLLPVQRAFNKLRAKKLKNASLMANGKWMLPMGAQVSDESLTDEEGEVVEYNPAVPEPHQAQIAPLPNYVSELEENLITDFRDVGGQRETTVSPPPGVTAGVAMQIQAELADEIINPILRRTGRAIQLVAEQQLLLMNQEWNDPRRIKILGERNAAQVQQMTKMDLKNHTDVHIEVESMFPEFRGAKRQLLIDLWDRRVIQDPKVFLRTLRFGNLDEIMEDLEKVDESIKLDIEDIKRGKEPQIHPMQNHLEYVRILSDWIQTPEFLRIPEERKQLALKSLQAHTQMVLGTLPGGGAPQAQQNQAAVGSEFGSIRPVGAPGSQTRAGSG